MATTITAGNATNGAAISSDNTGILELKTGTGAGTTAVTIGTDQSVTFAGAISSSGNQTVTGNLTVNGNTTLGDANTDTILMTAAPSIGGAGLGMGFGFRNRIINGAMVIDQRNAGAAVTANGAFPVDRYQVSNTSDGAYSAQQDSSAPAGFVNSVKVTTTTADASLTTTQQLAFRHIIEGLNVADLGWGTASAQTVTLSFWVRSSLTGTFGGSLQNSAANRSYVFTYTISAANTWEQKTITVPGDTTGTWLTTNGRGIVIWFGLGVGPSASGTAGSWSASELNSATGAVSVIGTLNATWQITGVQLEKGSTATSFDYRPYTTELQLCQRYFETSFNAGTAPANNVSDNFSGTHTLYVGNDGNTQNIPFKVTKRAAASITYYSSNQKASPTANQWQYYNGTAWVDATLTQTNRASDSSFNVYYKTAGFSTGQSNSFFGGWAASAEL
jgi:hypothetical protein